MFKKIIKIFKKVITGSQDQQSIITYKQIKQKKHV